MATFSSLSFLKTVRVRVILQTNRTLLKECFCGTRALSVRQEGCCERNSIHETWNVVVSQFR
jgi:hypothetical protein